MKKYLVILVSVGFAYGCNNSVKENNSDAMQNVQVETVNESEHEHAESETIELNNGSKWKVVPEMMQHIKNMESDVNRFAQTKHSELKEYTKLSEELQKNIDLLTSNCTMEGKAHDELHKWLLPYIDLVDKLNKTKNIDEALSIYEEIKSSFKTLNIYFE